MATNGPYIRLGRDSMRPSKVLGIKKKKKKKWKNLRIFEALRSNGKPGRQINELRSSGGESESKSEFQSESEILRSVICNLPCTQAIHNCTNYHAK